MSTPSKHPNHEKASSKPNNNRDKNSLFIPFFTPEKNTPDKTTFIDLYDSFSKVILQTSKANTIDIDFICRKTLQCNPAVQIKVASICWISLGNYQLINGYYSFLISSCANIINNILDNVGRLIRKYWSDFQAPIQDNIFYISKSISASNFELTKFTFMPLIQNIEIGRITSSNLKILSFFQQSIQSYGAHWKTIPIQAVLIILKFLRVYQDYFALENRFNHFNQTQKNLFQTLGKITKSFTVSFSQFFQMNIYSVYDLAPSSLFRILYDPKTISSMKSTFPSFYKIPPHREKGEKEYTFHGIGTVHISIVQSWLPYNSLCAMLRFNIENNNPNSSDYLIPIFSSHSPNDPDLMLADFARNYLLSPDIKLETPAEHKAQVLLKAMKFAIQRKTNLLSFPSALVSELLFVDSLKLQSQEGQKQVIAFALPVFQFIMMANPTYPEISHQILALLADHLQCVHYKKVFDSSLALVVNFFKSTHLCDFFMIIEHIKLPSDIAQKFLVVNTVSQNNFAIPAIITQFRQSRQPLSSQFGSQAISQAVQSIISIFSTSDQKSSLKGAISIMDALIPPDRASIELVFGSVPIQASLGFSFRNFSDAKLMMKFLSDRKKYDAFDQLFDSKMHVEMKYFYDELTNMISVEPESIWMPFLTQTKVFRNSCSVIRVICQKATSHQIIELSMLPMFDMRNDDKTSENENSMAILADESQKWPCDSILNLIQLMKGRILKPQDLIAHQKWFVTSISRLSLPIIQFFEETLILQGLSKEGIEFIKAVSMTGSPKGIELNKHVRTKWNQNTDDK